VNLWVICVSVWEMNNVRIGGRGAPGGLVDMYVSNEYMGGLCEGVGDTNVYGK